MPRSGVVRAVVLVVWNTGFQCLRFHFKIDLSVSVGSLQRDMTKPSPDGVNVDPGAEQMNGAGVTNGMGTDLFVPQRRGRKRRFGDRALYQSMNSETSYSLTTDIEEHRSILGAFQSRAEKIAQDVDRVGPKGAEPDLSSFAEESYRSRRGVELKSADVGV